MTRIGSRIGAILGADNENKIINMVGYGVYEKDECPPVEIMGLPEDEMDILRDNGYTNPKLVMDDGSIAWGRECWWGAEERVKLQLKTHHEDWEIVTVSMPEERAKAKERRDAAEKQN